MQEKSPSSFSHTHLSSIKETEESLIPLIEEIEAIPLLRFNRQFFTPWRKLFPAEANEFKADTAEYTKGLNAVFREYNPEDISGLGKEYSHALAMLFSRANPEEMGEYLSKYPKVAHYIQEQLPNLQAISDKWIGTIEAYEASLLSPSPVASPKSSVELGVQEEVRNVMEFLQSPDKRYGLIELFSEARKDISEKDQALVNEVGAQKEAFISAVDGYMDNTCYIRELLVQQPAIRKALIEYGFTPVSKVSKGQRLSTVVERTTGRVSPGGSV